MDNNNTDKEKKETKKNARTHRTLPKIHLLTNRELGTLAGGHIHWDRKLPSNWTGVCAGK